MKDILKPTFVLLITAMVASALLAVVYEKTSPEIEKRAKEKLLDNLKTVFPVEGAEYKPIIKDTLWCVEKDGKRLGIIFVNGMRGYSSVIKVIVGVDTTGKIVGVHIPKEGLSETPGLGMKVTEPWFMEQFKGKREEEVKLKKDGGTLDAITAATISSRAATNAVRSGMEKYKKYLKEEEKSENEWYHKHLSEFFPDAEIEECGNNFWVAVKDNETLGSIYLSYGEGYGGKFGVLVAVKDGKIKDIYIQSPDEGFPETQEFGCKVREHTYLKKFIGISPDEAGKIDDVTGATITSEAVKKAVVSGYKRVGGE